MKILVQVVEKASVSIDGSLVSNIERGELILVGFKPGDNKSIAIKMIEKLLKLRIFSDGVKTNCSLQDIDGSILAVSQFTLYANLKDGNRPSFSTCLNKEEAKILFDYFKDELQKRWEKTAFGVFHADMKVSLVNDGPFTVVLDSEELGYE